MSTDRQAELLTTLTDGIAALTSSQKWQGWLTAQSRFHTYSFNNALLICLQDPEATRVAGFQTWKNLGRGVRKGEKAIWIMAPMTRKVATDDPSPAEEATTDEPKATRVLSGFKAVPVFDIRQTDGEPLPEVSTRLSGDAPGVYTQLVEVAHSIGYTVAEEYLDGSRNGDCTYDLKRIRVEARNKEAQQVKTLAHELAHGMLHDGYTDRALCELEAESVAFIVCASLGINSDSYSFGYVAGWAGGGDQAVAAIKASGVAIQATANEILAGVQLDGAGEQAA
jgi:antirestriction protein ArdC